jgi:hypothetical protein
MLREENPTYLPRPRMRCELAKGLVDGLVKNTSDSCRLSRCMAKSGKRSKCMWALGRVLRPEVMPKSSLSNSRRSSKPWSSSWTILTWPIWCSPWLRMTLTMLTLTLKSQPANTSRPKRCQNSQFQLATKKLFWEKSIKQHARCSSSQLRVVLNLACQQLKLPLNSQEVHKPLPRIYRRMPLTVRILRS